LIWLVVKLTKTIPMLRRSYSMIYTIHNVFPIHIVLWLCFVFLCLCSQFLWIVHFLLPLRYPLTFINSSLLLVDIVSRDFSKGSCYLLKISQCREATRCFHRDLNKIQNTKLNDKINMDSTNNYKKRRY